MSVSEYFGKRFEATSRAIHADTEYSELVLSFIQGGITQNVEGTGSSDSTSTRASGFDETAVLGLSRIQ